MPKSARNVQYDEGHVRERSRQKQREVQAYDYRDADGTLLYQTVHYEPEDFRQRKPDGQGGWIYTDVFSDRERVLYRLPELRGDLARRPEDPILVVPAEKDVDRARNEGFIATTGVSRGTDSKRSAVSARQELAGCDVIVIGDEGHASETFYADVIEVLEGSAKYVVPLHLPRLPHAETHGVGLSEWFDKYGGTAEELHMLIRTALSRSKEVQEEPDVPPATASESRGERISHAQALVIMAIDAGIELFHDSDDVAYATVPVGDHTETHRLHSNGFRKWLTWVDWQAMHKAAGSQAMQDALNLLEAQAQFEGPELPVFLRVGEYGGKAYLDMGDNLWRAIEIDVEGWRVIDCPPVKFRRSKGMQSLPEPVREGSLSQLWEFANVAEEEQPLFAAFLTAAMSIQRTYPILDLQGGQGSAKTTTARIARECVDPVTAPVRAEPREPRDLAVTANNGWMPAFDNLSTLSPWLSDALCGLSTGRGFAMRTLYSDDDETILNARRPVILTGIPELTTRSDLLDRALLLHLPGIHPSQVRTEKEFWQSFSEKHGGILGALLDLLVGALRELPNVRLDRKPRMADFACWGVACERAAGWKTGTFLSAYERSRTRANFVALESSSVAQALQSAIKPGQAFRGTTTELKELLERDGDVKKVRGWPSSTKSLTNEITRIAPNLCAIGFVLGDGPRHTNHGTVWETERQEQLVPDLSLSSPLSSEHGKSQCYENRSAMISERSLGAVSLSDERCVTASSSARSQHCNIKPLEIHNNGESDTSDSCLADGSSTEVRTWRRSENLS